MLDATNAGTLMVRVTWSDPVTGQAMERTAPLPITIGRTAENTVVLNSDRVSRLHTTIESKGFDVVIRDHNSRNGTYVEERRITEEVLRGGETIQIGPFRLAAEITLSAQPSASGSMPAAPLSSSKLTPRLVAVRWTHLKTGESRALSVATPAIIGRQPGCTIVLLSTQVSREHAMIEIEGDQVIVSDKDSGNGTYVNGQRIERVVIKPGDVMQIDQFQLTLALTAPDTPRPSSANAVPPGSRPAIGAVLPPSQPVVVRPSLPTPAYTPPPAPLAPPPNDPTLVFSDQTGVLLPFVPEKPKLDPFPPPIFQQPVVPVWQLYRGTVTVLETTYLAIGGGIGSFTWVDHMLSAGVAPEQIVVLGLEPKPHSRYERLCRNSQIPGHERLRSNSDACPDNIWGWPSYGLREMWGSLKKGQLGNLFSVAWHIFGEPVLADTYTPRSVDVFAAMDKEAIRIGWGRIWRYGQAKAIRKTDDGRYAVAVTTVNERREPVNLVMLARFIHLAIGYPGVQFLADLQEYRDRTKDFKRVVNAYEQHDHIYDHLARQGGIVMVRGRGIVASRVLQRLYEMRRYNRNIFILHVMRSPLLTGHHYGHARRKVINHMDLQPFNWPKACGGGTLRAKLEKANDHERDRLLNDWGGTTTAKRADWLRIVSDGLREGWYQIRFGTAKRVEPNPYGQVFTLMKAINPGEPENWVASDFIIDCTGLEAALDTSDLLRDMVQHHRLGRSPKGRLRVRNNFEVEGMENGPGRMYAAGAMTLGGPLAMADSFLGLQFAALRSVEALAAIQAPGVKHIGPWRSFIQWTRWVRGVKP
ncbi:MAG TPA: FHA domain-containing protein [Ktedonobacterales bacterium]|jgi:pSer/pThr/pTyr-binding forkhead associated (FHA) protein